MIGKSIKILTTGMGFVCIIFAIITPSIELIQYLRTVPPELYNQLQTGALLFRIGLAVTGVVLILLPRLPIWAPDQVIEVKPLKNDRIFSALVTLLIVSFGLRLYDLNAGLWLDEILTHVKYARLPYGQIVTSFDSENQHFLFTLLAHTSYLLFGESAWALRLPAVLFGVGSILALYLLGREVANPLEGLLAAALMAFTYHHVWFSQNARGYTGLLFWTILSSWLFVRGLSGRRPVTWIYYSIAAALGVYTHLTMGFVLVAQGLIYLWMLVSNRKGRSKSDLTGFILAFGLTGLVIFLLHALPLPQIVTGMAGTESVVAEWRNPLWTLIELTRGLRLSFASGIVGVGAVILFGAGLIDYTRTRPVVVGLFIIPPVIGASLVIAAGHHLWPRFFFFTFGFGTLIVVRGALALSSVFAAWIGRLFSISSQRLTWIGTTVCVLMIVISAASIPFAYGPKQDYRAAMDYINQNYMDGDVVVTTYLAEFVYEQFYETGWEGVDSRERLEQIRNEAKRTWIVYTFEPVLESVNPDVLDVIQREFNCLKDFPGSVGSGAVVVCRADGLPETISVK